MACLTTGQELTMTRMIVILKTRLLCPRQRSPTGIYEALVESFRPGSDKTERLFLDEGVQAWVAYFLTTRNYGRYYKGQKQDHITIKAFKKLAEDKQRIVATSTTNTLVESSIATVINRLSKRYLRLAQDDEVPSSVTRSGLINPRKGKQTAIATMTAASFGYIGDKPTISTRVGNRTLNAEQQTISNPSIERIAAVFPEDMCGAIRSHSGKAGITMTFPYDVTSQVACLMSLDILAHKVASLAMNLFGIHVETDGGLRYIVLAYGVRCVPGQEMSFQGVGADAINTLLGPHIHSWVVASPARREEVK